MKIRKGKEIPTVIKKVGFDFSWDTKKVWTLDIPVEEIDITELEWHFNIPFWDKPNGGYYDLTPNQVLSDPEKYKEEYERTMKADLSHPLDVMLWKGKWLLFDGLHRLVKQKQLGKERVRVRKIPQNLIPKIKKRSKTSENKR